MRSQISDPELLEKVTPGYTIGCKRILPSNRWYRALSQAQRRAADRRRREGHARTRSSPATARSARSTRSSSAPASRSPTCRSAGWCAGRAARRSTTSGRAARKAHLGTAMPGFPNLFVLLGPEHRPRALLDGLHDRVAGGLRAGRAAPHGRARRRHRRGARGGGRALQRRPRRAHAGHGLEHRLRELVPRRDRPQLDAVAGLDVALPAAHRAASIPRTSSSPNARPATPSR